MTWAASMILTLALMRFISIKFTMNQRPRGRRNKKAATLAMYAFSMIYEGRRAARNDRAHRTDGRSALSLAGRFEFRIGRTTWRNAGSCFYPARITSRLNAPAQAVQEPKAHCNSPLTVAFGRGQTERRQNDRKILKREILGRPGDYLRSPEHDLRDNRAELRSRLGVGQAPRSEFKRK